MPCARDAAGPRSPCPRRTTARPARARRPPRGSRGWPPTRGPGGVRARRSCDRRAVHAGCRARSYVQSALRLLLAGPTPFTAVAGECAGGTADGSVPLIVERIVGKVVFMQVAPHVRLAPVGEGVELPKSA